MPTISTLTVDVESRTSGFSKGMKVAGAGLAALAAGAAYTFGQFEESERVAAQTDAVLKSTGDTANTTAKAVGNLANALASKTGVDDEAIQTGENMILTFKNIQNEAGKGNDIFDRTTKAVLDMSVAMGQDMKSSAIQVGKALNDPIAGMSALSRVGVTFTEEQKKSIEQMVKHNDLLGAQKLILGELNSEFKGSAEAQATASGKMKVALGNLAETVGGLLAPAITAILGKVTEWAQVLTTSLGPAVTAIGAWLGEHMGLVKTVAAVIGSLIIAYEAWAIATKIVAVAQAALAVVMAVNPFAVIALAIVAVAAIIVTNWGAIKRFLIESWNAIKDAASSIWNGIKDFFARFWPAILILFTGPVGAIAVLLIKNWNTIKDTTLDVWNAIKGAVTGAVDRVKEVISSALDTIREAWRTVWNGIRETFSGIWNGIVATARTALNGIIGVINAVIRGVNTLIGGFNALPFIGNIGTIPQIPALAKGGDILRTGIALVHEGETVVPSGNRGVTVVNNGTIVGGNPDDVADAIHKLLLRKQRRTALGLT